MNEALAARYLSILSEADPAFTDHIRANRPSRDGLSGLFLTSEPRSWRSGRRVLLVGRETKGWGDDKYDFAGWADYVEKAMAGQKRYFEGALHKRSTFQRFARRSLGSLQPQGAQGDVAWANLFAFDWRNGMPNPQATPHYGAILALSERLLKAAIETLEPDVIVFANGGGSAKIRRQYFPLDGVICRDVRNFKTDGIPDNELLAFTIRDKIQCYRINHPSAWPTESRARARRYLVEKLKAQFAAKG